ncbi:UbiD family decarboxylase [Paradesulfitobacterium ferrireducens]|uniref:UbiD family decarboxylase n=1 Tax=Paradesulfitobacterium ferrireducens TaxID=2816476 RepID=UPI001A9025EE|nr:UbiD family decarboxylase [Paradesulfitobacterium ferrireducens]
MPYRDLREYLQALEQNGLLHRVPKEVDKDWEVAAAARVLFQKVPSARRPAIMFDKVKGFDIPVVAGVLGASRAVYALAMETEVNNISRRWTEAQNNPVEPILVEIGPCKENILTGDRIDMLKFPVPVWTVGEDPSPYLTSPYVVTKDPETGVHNVGTYRVQVKASDRVGCMMNFHQHGRRHVDMHNRLGRPTPVAIVLGTDPTIGLCSVARIMYGLSEYSVAGGLRGKPVELVKCETSDLLVPATAEIVIEGEIESNTLVHEGPFGEYTGYMGPDGDAYEIKIKAITYRNNPIYQAFISQMPPSESSLIRSVGREAGLFKGLKEDLRLPVQEVRLKESGGAASYLVISVKQDGSAGLIKQVAWGAWAIDPTLGKFTVIVDDDIDIWDDFAVDWAMSFRVQPAKDCMLVPDTASVRLDPSTAPADEPQLTHKRATASKILIDATKKHNYPPLALPPLEHREQVLANAELYGFKGLIME